MEFEVIPSNAEEKVTKQEPSEVVEELSRQKAEDVAAAVEDGIVLGADTVVCQDGQIMGKPKDEADAKQMLQKLQGEEHSVYTGVTILVKENGAVQHVQTFSQETKVYVYEMTDEEIDRYIATESRWTKRVPMAFRDGSQLMWMASRVTTTMWSDCRYLQCGRS